MLFGFCWQLRAVPRQAGVAVAEAAHLSLYGAAVNLSVVCGGAQPIGAVWRLRGCLCRVVWYSGPDDGDYGDDEIKAAS